MAYADRFVGRALVLEWTPSGGSLVVFSGDQTAFSLDRSADTVDVTAAAEQDRSFLTTLRGAEFTCSMYAGRDSIMDDLEEGTAGRLDIYPRGKSSGMPKFAFNAIITGVNSSVPYDGAVEIEVTGVRNGAMIWDWGDVV